MEVRCASVSLIAGNDIKYKFFWVGSNSGNGGVGIQLVEKWIESQVIDVDRVNDRMIIIKIIVGEILMSELRSLANSKTKIEWAIKYHG